MSLMPRCSSPHLCTPTQRTEGGSGVGEIPTAPFGAGVAEGTGGGMEVRSAAVAAGVAEGMGVSSARNTSNGNWKASAQKPTWNGRDRLRRCCFMGPFDQTSVISIFRTHSQGGNEYREVPSLSTGRL